MKKLLTHILSNTEIVSIIGSTDVPVASIRIDSRKVAKNDLFIAIKGTQVDGHQYISSTIEQGACSIICETLPNNIKPNICYIQVKDSSKTAGIIASNFYDNPSQNIALVGVTGTNGKTTTATLLYRLFKNLGYKVGLISTIKNIINDKEIISTHTTPDAISINELLKKMVDQACEFCFMEVSSHAIDQKRIAGLTFRGGIFTNITHEHLDYHKTFKEYIQVKKLFFDNLPETAFALVNKDDKNGMVMLQNTKASKNTFGILNLANFKAKIIETHLDGQLLDINQNELWTKLIGTFNAYNILGIYATALLLGEDNLDVLTHISELTSVDGRFEVIRSKDGVIGIVDYAHTPDALQNVLETITNLRTGNEQLITVVGCGGNRDTAKRPIMAKLAADYSNKIILTSDNPRNEDPQAILDEMIKGLDPIEHKKALVIADRKEAIKTANMLSEKGDIILVAGKGHEKYQEIKGVKHPFDDTQILNALFNNH